MVSTAASVIANIAASRLQMIGEDLTLLASAFDHVLIDLGAGVERTVRQPVSYTHLTLPTKA